MRASKCRSRIHLVLRLTIEGADVLLVTTQQAEYHRLTFKTLSGHLRLGAARVEMDGGDRPGWTT